MGGADLTLGARGRPRSRWTSQPHHADTSGAGRGASTLAAAPHLLRPPWWGVTPRPGSDTRATHRVQAACRSPCLASMDGAGGKRRVRCACGAAVASGVGGELLVDPGENVVFSVHHASSDPRRSRAVTRRPHESQRRLRQTCHRRHLRQLEQFHTRLPPQGSPDLTKVVNHRRTLSATCSRC